MNRKLTLTQDEIALLGITYKTIGNRYRLSEDDIEKVMDVSSMPRYIKEDWINYNKKELNQKVLDKHIKVYTDKSDMQYPPDKEIEEIISTLKSIKRHLLIKKII